MNPVNANTSGSAHTLLRIACKANNRPIIPPSDSEDEDETTMIIEGQEHSQVGTHSVMLPFHENLQNAIKPMLRDASAHNAHLDVKHCLLFTTANTGGNPNRWTTQLVSYNELCLADDVRSLFPLIIQTPEVFPPGRSFAKQ